MGCIFSKIMKDSSNIEVLDYTPPRIEYGYLRPRGTIIIKMENKFASGLKIILREKVFYFWKEFLCPVLMSAELVLIPLLMILLLSYLKIMMRSHQFDHLSKVELLQNIHDYLDILKREPYLYCNFTLKIYLKWNIDRIYLKLPKYFPKIMAVLENLEDNDPFFRPGCAVNERRYYNLLLHYGKK